MNIALAADHAGFAYKERVKAILEQKAYHIHDFGTRSDKAVDYPDYIRPAAVAVARGDCERGIVFGGSGNGEAIVANRIRGVRCAVCWNEESARLARLHNDANMLAIGQRLIEFELVASILDIWLSTPFDGGRHLRRINKIDEPVDQR